MEEKHTSIELLVIDSLKRYRNSLIHLSDNDRELIKDIAHVMFLEGADYTLNRVSEFTSKEKSNNGVLKLFKKKDKNDSNLRVKPTSDFIDCFNKYKDWITDFIDYIESSDDVQYSEGVAKDIRGFRGNLEDRVTVTYLDDETIVVKDGEHETTLKLVKIKNEFKWVIVEIK